MRDLLIALRLWLIAKNPGFGEMRWQNWVGLTMILAPVFWFAGYLVIYGLLYHTVLTLLIAYFFTAMILAPWRSK